MSSAYFLQFFQFFLEGSYFISFFFFGVFHTIIRLDSVYLVVSFPLEVSFVVLSSAFFAGVFFSVFSVHMSFLQHPVLRYFSFFSLFYDKFQSISLTTSCSDA